MSLNDDEIYRQTLENAKESMKKVYEGHSCLQCGEPAYLNEYGICYECFKSNGYRNRR